MIDKTVTNDKELGIDAMQYVNFEEAFRDIEDDIISYGEICNQ